MRKNNQLTPKAMTKKKKIYTDVQMVAIETIKPSPFENANEFSQELFASFKKDIETNGLIGQSLIVNPKDNTLVDGHHRLRAMQELGYEEVPVIYYEPQDETEHKILSIALNKKRGNFNEQKLHTLIKSIHDSGKYSLEELAEKLGFNNTEIREKLEAIKIDQDLINKLENDAKEQELALPVLMTFSVSQRDAEFIEEAIVFANQKTRGESLAQVCGGYLHYMKD